MEVTHRLYAPIALKMGGGGIKAYLGLQNLEHTALTL